MSQEYFEEAEAGASLIAVLAPVPRLVTESGRILASREARRMRFCGNLTITDVCGTPGIAPARRSSNAPPAMRRGRARLED